MILWPKLGLSTVDCMGKPFWDPDADKALIDGLRKDLDTKITIKEIDAFINDPEFARMVVQEFVLLIKSKKGGDINGGLLKS